MTPVTISSRNLRLQNKYSIENKRIHTNIELISQTTTSSLEQQIMNT